MHNLFYILVRLPFILLESYSWEKPSSCNSAQNTFVSLLRSRKYVLLKVDNLKYSHVLSHKRHLYWCPSAETSVSLLLRHPKGRLACSRCSRNGGILVAGFPLPLDYGMDCVRSEGRRDRREESEGCYDSFSFLPEKTCREENCSSRDQRG